MKIFITSTSTDIGKTYVTLLLYQAFSQQGLHVGLYKPFQTEEQENGVYPDLEAYQQVSGLDYDETGLYKFHEPVSPHLGFKLEPNKVFDRQAIIDKANQLNQKYDILLIEGAGGLGVPIYQEGQNFYMTEDLIRDTADFIVSVIPSKLGAISDTIMHDYYLEKHDLPKHRYIMNRFDDSMIAQDNYQTLKDYLRTEIEIIKENARVEDISETFLHSILRGDKNEQRNFNTSRS